MAKLLLRLLDLAGFGAVEQVMRHRSFRIYLVGHIPNVIGVWVVRVAIGWLAWQLTGSAFWLGAVAAADALPVLALGPIGGVMADRLDRRIIATVTQAALAVIAVILAALTFWDLMTIWILFSLALARGITAAFWQPVRLALMPNLVPRAEIPIAIALNSSTFNTAQFIGPAVAAGLLSLGGPSLAFAFNIFAASFMVWVLLVIDSPLAPLKKGSRASVFADVVAGMKYGLTHAGIAPMLLLLLILGLSIRPLTELLPGFADLVFGLGADGFSLMVSSLGAGAAVGAIWMLRQGNRGGITAIALRAGLLGGAAALIFALTTWLPLALVCLAVLGFSMTTGGIATQQLVQLSVPDEMRGRVLSLFGMVFRAGPSGGALLMGWIADVAGLSWPVGIGAALGLIAYIIGNGRRARLEALLETPNDVRCARVDTAEAAEASPPPAGRAAE
ncbi:MAG: MFS transporter [Alphaproteobacteria bacterium]|nr:MFS transporter [Alphaproteobacteria bacterium]